MTLTFAVDLDGTIARRNTARLIAKCVRYFGLVIPSEQLAGLSWQEWKALPEVQAYRARVGERAWERNLSVVALDPAYQRSMLQVEGAVEGVKKLALAGQILYATARKTTFSEEWNEKMEQATRAWLSIHAFPSADQVVFCTSPEEKVQVLAEQVTQSGGTVVLIDDSYKLLASYLDTLAPCALWRRSFVLAAFGTENTETGKLALPCWSAVEPFLQAIDRFVAQPL